MAASAMQIPAAWMSEVKRLLPLQNINVVAGGAAVAEMKKEYARSLQILLSVCCLVLLIACANVGNLLLARGMARAPSSAWSLAYCSGFLLQLTARPEKFSRRGKADLVQALRNLPLGPACSVHRNRFTRSLRISGGVYSCPACRRHCGNGPTPR